MHLTPHILVTNFECDKGFGTSIAHEEEDALTLQVSFAPCPPPTIPTPVAPTPPPLRVVGLEFSTKGPRRVCECGGGGG